MKQAASKRIPNKTEKKERMAAIVERLKALYPDSACSLRYEGEGWKLLIMGRLSAQCTDERVNRVCVDLFREFPTARAIADAELPRLEEVVRSCGLYRTKAKNIKDACAILCDEHGGEVPRDMESLLRLPGVGRKIANLLLGDLYGIPGIVADTHCIRLGGRFGMYEESLKVPEKVEAILAELVAPEEQTDLCHRLVDFGRDRCTAQSPRCVGCPLKDLCDHGRMKED